jgi:hypothetical protein
MTTSPQLTHFFSCYFHQDWNIDDADWQSVVRRFRTDTSPDEVRATAKELRALLSSTVSEAELEQHLDALGCYYTPRPDIGGPLFSQWLAEVCSLLEASI